MKSKNQLSLSDDLLDRMIFVKSTLSFMAMINRTDLPHDNIIEVAHFLCREMEDLIHIYKDFLNEFKRE